MVITRVTLMMSMTMLVTATKTTKMIMGVRLTLCLRNGSYKGERDIMSHPSQGRQGNNDSRDDNMTIIMKRVTVEN